MCTLTVWKQTLDGILALEVFLTLKTTSIQNLTKRQMRAYLSNASLSKTNLKDRIRILRNFQIKNKVITVALRDQMHRKLRKHNRNRKKLQKLK